MALVLGIDPGFSNVGLALVDVLPNEDRIVYLELLETEKSGKKTNVMATDDNFYRGRLIASAILDKFHSAERPALIVSESMSHVRNSSVSSKLTYIWGILASVSVMFDVPVLQATPQQIKIALTGNKKADKKDIAAALDARFGLKLLESKGLSGISKPKHEHPLDALAAIVTCSDSDIMKMLRHSGGNK